MYLKRLNVGGTVPFKERAWAVSFTAREVHAREFLGLKVRFLVVSAARFSLGWKP
jgi:hypothetical protein